VEQEQEMWPQGQQIHHESQQSNLNSTPPILRRRARKRDAEDEKLDQFLRSPNMSFDMTGSLTSTPTHAGLATSGGGSYPPTAQSTPVSALHKVQASQGSLLTTPTLSSDDPHPASAHSTPKTSRLSPTSSRHSGEAPRTPTPFKRALAAVYSGREPLSNTPQTPTKRIDEFMEIIKKDMLDTDRQYTDISFSQADLSADQQTLQDSGYGGTDKRPRPDFGDAGDKENSSPNRKAHGQGARKALATKWSTPASLPQMMFPGSVGDSSLLNPETPSKSLLGATDSSIMFSPLSVSKDTLHEEAGPGTSGHQAGSGSDTDPSPASKVDVRWNMIACGKTRPSLDMTEHARQYLSGIKPRSLNL